MWKRTEAWSGVEWSGVEWGGQIPANGRHDASGFNQTLRQIDGIKPGTPRCAECYNNQERWMRIARFSALPLALLRAPLCSVVARGLCATPSRLHADAHRPRGLGAALAQGIDTLVADTKERERRNEELLVKTALNDENKALLAQNKALLEKLLSTLKWLATRRQWLGMISTTGRP